jgi:16S rRNA (cytosine1402-N4)-methyltransferase
LRFNAESGNLTAAEVIKKLTVEELTRIIKEYGEQAQANKIAQALKQYLPQTTFQLTEIVSRVIPYTQKEKSLSRVFQTLRIYVNRELDNLKKFLRKITGYLTSGGRLVVISYHSLEDRIVKEFLKREAQDCLCPPGIPVCICGHKATFKIVTPQPLVPSEEEIKHNPRSKSARLRSGERL